MVNNVYVIPKWLIGISLCCAMVIGCSKGGSDTGNANACAGVTVNVSAAVTNALQGKSDGKIEAAATGGSGVPTFSLNGGAFQTSGTFSNLPKGAYTVTAKYPAGCAATATFQVNETDPCANTITVTATGTTSDPCKPSGKVTVNATGGTNFTYSLNSGAFQTSNIFLNVGVGNHTVTAKETSGCGQTSSVSITSAAAGPLFDAVRSIVGSNCAVSGCHNGVQPPNFTVDCNIVANSSRIKARAVDGSPSFMPPTGPLPIADRDKISSWVTAGGKFTD